MGAVRPRALSFSWPFPFSFQSVTPIASPLEITTVQPQRQEIGGKSETLPLARSRLIEQRGSSPAASSWHRSSHSGQRTKKTAKPSPPPSTKTPCFFDL